MQTAPQRFFYGWVIVAAATAIIATGMGLMDALGVFMEPLETTFGWGCGQIGRASLVCWLVSGLSSLLCGALSDRIGTRVVVLCGGLVFGVGMLRLTTV
jgi:MFS family permease